MVRQGVLRVLMTSLIVLPGLVAAGAEAAADEVEQELRRLERIGKAFEMVAKKVKPAVVHVSPVFIMNRSDRFGQPGPYSRDPFRDFFGEEFYRRFFGERMPRGESRRKGLGSGVVVDPKGYILTNNHVVHGADEIEVKLSDKREFKAKVVGTDPKTDLAVIKVESAEELPGAELGDSDAMEVGHWVLAIGNPFGLDQTVTAGIISAKGRSNLRVVDYEDFIQTDAAINPGNSGGPLVNLRGEVIGINTAIFTRTGGYMGIGLAIPSNMAKSIMKSLIETGKVTRGWLGVQIEPLTPDAAEALGVASTEGVLVKSVLPGTPAQAAGLQPGDVILTFDGKKTPDPKTLQKIVARTSVDREVVVKIIREGKGMDLKANIAEQPSDLRAAVTGQTEELGMAVESLTPELAARLSYEGETGVVITAVRPGSPAAEAGLASGNLIKEVNREKVQNTAQFHSLIAKADKTKPILLLVRDRTRTVFIILRVPEKRD